MKNLSVRYFQYLVLVAFSLFFSLLLGRMEPMIAAVPFVVALAYSLFLDRAPRMTVTHEISSAHVFEGDSIDVSIVVDAGAEIPVVEILDPLPPTCRVTHGTNDIVASFRAGERKEYRYTLVPFRRGRFSIGGLVVSAQDSTRMIRWELEAGESKDCVAYPRITPLRHRIRPSRTQANVGNYPSRAVGDGIEFAEIRAYASGDSVRRINWRASMRLGQLTINEYMMERNADIILMLDSFADSGTAGFNSMDLSCRVVATLAHHFLRGKNRVGFIEYGSGFRWVLPSLGGRQWYRILEILADVEVVVRFASKDLSTVPRTILPPHAMILAVTPFIDERFSGVLRDLAGRGYDVLAIAVASARTLETCVATDRVNRAALRLWRLQERDEIDALRRVGLPVVEWEPGDPLDLLARAIDALRTRRGISA